MNKLIFIFPIDGPINGVKVIAKELLSFFDKEQLHIININTAQAKSYSNFGKFNFGKILFVAKIFNSLLHLDQKNNVYMNFTTKGFSFYRDFFIVWFLTFKKSNITLHIHQNGLEKIKSKFVFKVLNKAKIIVINNQQQQDLKKFKNLYCVYNVLPDFYNGIFQPAVSSTSEYIQLLFMSNISVPKGINLLLQICQKIKERQLNYQITICGGILDNYSQSVINQLQSDFNFITFLGPIEDDIKKMEIYKTHDFLLFLSDNNYEVSPLVYIEALMNGLPIITTPQIIAKNVTAQGSGIIIENENFIDFISDHCQHELLLKLKLKNRIKFEKEYNFTAFYKSIKNIVFDES